MKCPLTLDCSRAGTVPATQRTSSDPALFSAPDPTHYREYIYYHLTTPYQPSQEAGVWRAKCNKIGMKIRHTYVRIYGHAECAYTDLRLHIRTYRLVCICRLMSTYKDLLLSLHILLWLSLHMQTYVCIMMT